MTREPLLCPGCYATLDRECATDCPERAAQRARHNREHEALVRVEPEDLGRRTRIVLEKASRWSLPPASAVWLGRARHDAALARDWDARALRVLERGRRDQGARAEDLSRRGEECWVGAVVALLSGLR